MTDDEQNNAIAAATGIKPSLDWNVLSPDETSTCFSGTKAECIDWLNTLQMMTPNSPFVKYHVGPLPIWPKFTASLDAMHLAEQTLTPKQFLNYVDNHLFEVCRGDNNAFWSIISKWTPAMVHASAAQRAESFLRTLNLWRD